MDNTMLTTEQMEVAKKLIEFTQNFSDQVVHIMKNHGLWQKGFELKLRIDPLAECLTEENLQRWMMRKTLGNNKKAIVNTGISKRRLERR